jgi:hypothetical protein
MVVLPCKRGSQSLAKSFFSLAKPVDFNDRFSRRGCDPDHISQKKIFRFCQRWFPVVGGMQKKPPPYSTMSLATPANWR